MFYFSEPEIEIDGVCIADEHISSISEPSAITRGHMYVMSSVRGGGHYCKFLMFYNLCLEGERGGFLLLTLSQGFSKFV